MGIFFIQHMQQQKKSFLAKYGHQPNYENADIALEGVKAFGGLIKDIPNSSLTIKLINDAIHDGHLLAFMHHKEFTNFLRPYRSELLEFSVKNFLYFANHTKEEYLRSIVKEPETASSWLRPWLPEDVIDYIIKYRDNEVTYIEMEKYLKDSLEYKD